MLLPFDSCLISAEEAAARLAIGLLGSLRFASRTLNALVETGWARLFRL